MRLPVRTRLLSLLTLLLFAAGISYHHFCEAQLLDCQPCQVEIGHSGDGDNGCKDCERSAELGNSLQLTKHAALAYVFLVANITQQIVLTPPQHIAQAFEPPRTDLPLAFILRDIKQSIPIRGPSITA